MYVHFTNHQHVERELTFVNNRCRKMTRMKITIPVHEITWIMLLLQAQGLCMLVQHTVSILGAAQHFENTKESMDHRPMRSSTHNRAKEVMAAIMAPILVMPGTMMMNHCPRDVMYEGRISGMVLRIEASQQRNGLWKTSRPVKLRQVMLLDHLLRNNPRQHRLLPTRKVPRVCASHPLRRPMRPLRKSRRICLDKAQHHIQGLRRQYLMALGTRSTIHMVATSPRQSPQDHQEDQARIADETGLMISVCHQSTIDT
jgi:hypothetical protein